MLKKSQIVLVLLFGAFFILAFKPEAKYLKKAEKSIEKGNLKDARAYYKRALAKQPNSFDANFGMGMMLCELLDNYSEALPYLEKALDVSGKKDTLKDLAFSLAKCYQHQGEFEKAIQFYNLLNGCVDYDDEIDLGKELQKRKDDCQFALTHKNSPKNENIFIVNAGKTINTDMPEYVPVLTPQGELIFTSKRKDNLNEELSYLDGKYYESMYISKLDSLGFKKVRRYTLPDLFVRSHFAKYHESVISISPDGKKLFTYRDNRIFEININDRARFKPQKVLKTIHFNYYQNHAFVSRDGKTLYFTSDAKGGIGGNDIYKSVKDKDGKWGKPVNLGDTINTSFDEEAPFLTDDGNTLYFSSRGHEGYGNFDIYKSNLVDGKWTKPQNLGEPINSPGHDVFMIHDSTSSVGYFSSSRSGGFGDMDIYKIIYIDKINKQCPQYNHGTISLSISDDNAADYKNKIVANVPSNYKVLFYEWRVNDIKVDSSGATLEHDYLAEGTYRVDSKIVALCDTCLVPMINCVSINNEFKKPEVVVTENTAGNINVAITTGVLNNEQLTALGFNLSPMLFDFNRSEVRKDALQILGPNIELLKKYPDLQVEIIGYSDVRGTEVNNQRVSEQRAKSIKRCLLNNGVKQSQVIACMGKGASDLVNDCGVGKACDERAHQQNRRVIFRISKK